MCHAWFHFTAEEELAANIDYGTDFEDGIPVVAEGTTFNIHGGRDMFAKRSPAKMAKPPIAKKPSQEIIARHMNPYKPLSHE